MTPARVPRSPNETHKTRAARISLPIIPCNAYHFQSFPAMYALLFRVVSSIFTKSKESAYAVMYLKRNGEYLLDTTSL